MKRVVVVSGNEEFDVPDPKMYVTRVINPEREIKKKQMAKELEAALQEQIAVKKRLKEEERHNRIAEELREEERLKKEKEAMQHETELQKQRTVEKEETSDQKSPKKESKADPELTPVKAPVVEKPFRPPHTHALDQQLQQLHSEMLEKEKEFYGELEKLKLAAVDSSNTRELTTRQLTQLKDHIMQKPEGVSTLSYRPDSNRYSVSIPSRISPASGTGHSHGSSMDNKYLQSPSKGLDMGKYSKLYFTDYNKALSMSTKTFASRDELLGRRQFRTKFKAESLLPGESQMLPWNPKPEAADTVLGKKLRREPINAQVHSSVASQKMWPPGKTAYERLDYLMKEFLTPKPQETAAENKKQCTIFPGRNRPSHSTQCDP